MKLAILVIAQAVAQGCLLWWMWTQMKINKLTGKRLEKLEKK